MHFARNSLNRKSKTTSTGVEYAASHTVLLGSDQKTTRSAEQLAICQQATAGSQERVSRLRYFRAMVANW